MSRLEGTMPRYHFPIIDGTRLDDSVGIEFPDEDAARKHADTIAAHMPPSDRRVLVENSDGEEVHSVSVNTEDAAADPVSAKLPSQSSSPRPG